MNTTARYLPLLMLCMLLMACGADRALKQGDQLYATGDYFDAAAQYRKAYSQTSPKERMQRGQITLRQAECYRRINYTARAITAYRNALRYKQGDSATRMALGQQLLKVGQYKEAAKVMAEMLDSCPQNSMAQTLLASARKAPQWKKEGSRYKVKREDVFNSRRSDYSPVLAGAEHDRLYLTSTRNEATGDDISGITGTKNADIFMAQKDEQGRWQRPQVIDTELNSNADEGACCLSPDGLTMYLTSCQSDERYPRFATIVTSRRSDATWNKPQPLPITRDTLSLYAHPAVSPDGQWLYFVSDMPGGMGGKDLWRVRLTEAGLGGVENLGTPVNTPGDEMFPTFRPNGDLYFSSDGHEGMGGLDIYIAHPTASGWTIVHPSYPLNSMGDDFGMTFEGNKNRGFFSSNRGDAHGWDHIYSFENPEIIQTVRGWVYEREGYELPQAVVYMVGNDGTNLRLSVMNNGSFTQTVRPGVDYVLMASCPGYLNHQTELHVVETDESQEHVLQFPLASITAPVLIDNIHYDFDRATLRPESMAALDSLVTLLNTNPHVAIELSAHCDYKGKGDYNKRLSQRRAEAVAHYLTAHGISADRLTAVGYGKEQPKTIKHRLAVCYPFIQENTVLTEDFIKTLTPEQQEICNQLNRRTEFRVTNTTYGMFDANGQLIRK